MKRIPSAAIRMLGASILARPYDPRCPYPRSSATIITMSEGLAASVAVVSSTKQIASDLTSRKFSRLRVQHGSRTSGFG